MDGRFHFYAHISWAMANIQITYTFRIINLCPIMCYCTANNFIISLNRSPQYVSIIQTKITINLRDVPFEFFSRLKNGTKSQVDGFFSIVLLTIETEITFILRLMHYSCNIVPDENHFFAATTIGTSGCHVITTIFQFRSFQRCG